MSIVVRTITADELTERIDDLVRPLGEAFFSEKGLAGKFIPESFINTIQMMELANCGGTWVAEDSKTKEVHGALGWIITPVFFSDIKMLTDLFFYVFPNRRNGNSRVALALLNTFIRKGEEEKVQMRLFHFGVNVNSPIGNFYKRKGFVPLEMGYWRR